MKKLDIVNKISTETGIPKADVALTLEHVIKEIKASLKKENSVFMRGFGTFFVKHKKSKIGRVVKYNIPIQIPEQYVPAFKPSKQFVNEIKSIKKRS
ncbi:MAG: integration host factor subunit beta [Sediminibacterium sp.]|nr:integration host factor subunit beta [Sediminibacterium sp.]